MSQPNPATTRTRLLSLDFFRGVTVASMILVNNPGDWGHIYAPLEHSKWNGCTPTDLVFPFFLFIVGVSINYAIGDKKLDPANHKSLLLNAARRGAIIIGIGLLLTLVPNFDFAHIRLVGVLQRIGLVFFITAAIYVKTTRKTQLILFAAFLLVYWALMTLIPVPGIGAPNLEPGTNLAAWLDNLILTPNHMWRETKTWDPEGILSTLPSMSTCLFGLLVGQYLKKKDLNDADKTAWLFTTAAFAIVGGLCWNGVFPMNKALWTSSFVLFTGGLATAGLTLSYWLIDIQGNRRFITPFVAFGSNAITIYVGSGWFLLALSYVRIRTAQGALPFTEYLYQSLLTPLLSPINASLVSAIFFVAVMALPLWWMYKKKIFIKI